MPQRRWVYALTLSSSALVALFIQHISELSLKRYNLIAIPITIYGIIYFALAENNLLDSSVYRVDMFISYID